METAGRVLTAATIENLHDLWEVERGLRPPDQARRLELGETLVDPRMTGLSLPTRLIRRLGLTPPSTRQTLTAGGPRQETRSDAVRLTIQGRTVTVDATELPDGSPPMVGLIPLGFLDLVIDSDGHRLIGNPEHGGEQMFDMF